MNISEFLENSVYYPACEFDGTPIKFPGKQFSNFVYADYMVNPFRLKKDIVPNCLVSINPGLGFGFNFQGYIDAFVTAIRSSGKLPHYQFYDDQCADYFKPIIRYYSVMKDITHHRSDYTWSSHFRLAKLRTLTN